MSLACYGEMASAMFVLFLPILPRFFTWARDHSVSSLKSSRAPSPLDFADAGVPEGADKRSDKSLWRISYTQRDNDDEQGEAVWREEKPEGYVDEEGSIASVLDESVEVQRVSPIAP